MRAPLWLPAVSGALAVLLGAFGAHALEDRVTERALEVWDTANRYHAFHSLSLLALQLAALTGAKQTTLSRNMWVVGLLIFCGGLYLYALTGLKFGAMIAPVGGLALAAGWLALLRVQKPS